VSGRDVQPTLEQARPLRWAFQAAGSFVSGLASPRPWSSSASSFPRGASSSRPGHPAEAAGSPRRSNWRWSHLPRPPHRSRTPGRPVRAALAHATCRVQPDSAHFAACRVARMHAPMLVHLTDLPRQAPPYCAKLALVFCSVPSGAIHPKGASGAASGAIHPKARPGFPTMGNLVDMRSSAMGCQIVGVDGPRRPPQTTPLGKLAGRGTDPSRKQAAQGVKILREARKLGFKGTEPTHIPGKLTS
jgi:hypothetical protein